MSEVTLSKSAPLTSVSDQSGCTINICCPSWFDRREVFKVNNAPAYAAELSFSGDDLNFAARVLYAEATGGMSGVSDDELASEKLAILHVMYFRLNRKGYPRNDYVATTFRMVSEAPQVQFESVSRQTAKFVASAALAVDQLKPKDCKDLQSCLAAVRRFIANGPDFKAYPFDEFRARSARPSWHGIANNAFHLTKLGSGLLAGMNT
jgi:hypothetical protein